MLEGDKLRADQKLYNDLITLLGAMNIGWSPDTVDTAGKECVKVLSAALWYIDPCHHQFLDRSISLPSIFDQFQGYNNWKAKKENNPQLSCEGLTFHLNHLTHVLNQPWICKPAFKPLYDIIDDLAHSFNKYRAYLQRQCESWNEGRSSLTPPRSISESIELLPIQVVHQCKPQYLKVQQILMEKEMYSPIFLNELAPDDCHERKNWLVGMQLDFPTMMYRFMHGNNLGTLAFLWRTPQLGGEATSNARLVTELNSCQKVYSTREMHRMFIQRYTSLRSSTSSSSKAILRNMYKFLTGDCSSS